MYITSNYEHYTFGLKSICLDVQHFIYFLIHFCVLGTFKVCVICELCKQLRISDEMGANLYRMLHNFHVMHAETN